MSGERSYIQKLIEKVAEIGLERIKNTAESMGVVGEPVPRRVQAQAYRELTEDDWAALQATQTPEELASYIWDMEKG